MTDTSGQHRQRAAQAVAAALNSPGVPAVHYETLSGGTYNTVVRAHLTDAAEPWVIKLPPQATHPHLSYETRLLHAEATFYEAASTLPDVPVPRLVRHEPAPPNPHLIMTSCPGSPWHSANGDVAFSERHRLRRDLGGHVARLHTLTGPGFGYPAEPFGPLTATWREAFTAMTTALLDDAERYDATLPVGFTECRALLASAASSDALDEVTRPTLVHFDLWDGNLLLDGSPGDRRLSGIIDGERMFWGDPLADCVSLALFGDIEDDRAFLEGYAKEGDPLRFDAPARRRLALYRAYLYLIMLVESVPRAYSPQQLARTQERVAPHLLRALDDLRS
ncbi:aminoglycoside phosphotransferase family protein [Streptomyces sp. A7024]|uniref:Aminoglycoside phosphotransferase family protein n=1 Tax=Streptomyces coryli TaxID=1128680 RepID=A0A6G4U9B8_9ACTN|nr:aminoglycoside phosphotransferase family protein [Streptomyces coryli]NGN68835.1 aminoglycoside phosphotransferase family protein [Streptomyces coryli]